MHATKTRNPLLTLVRTAFATRGRIVAAAVVAVLAAGAAAFAYWSADSGTGGSAAASAASVNQGATPSPTPQAGRKVQVTWGASTLDNGQAVDGYIVKRYDATSNTQATTLGSCDNTVAGLSCTESNVPVGSWKYTVTPKIGDNWLGTESAKSGAVSVGSATLTLGDTLLGGGDFSGGNATLTGTLSGFAGGEGITYHLDSPSGTTLSGTPSTADSSGGASVSITLPQPSDGAHTIYAVGDDASPSQASAAVTVDTNAPTTQASTDPAPTSAGWNSTSPVSVTLSPDDGTGSGVDFVKYTTDGSDPKSGGTTYTGPISISSTTTVKYYSRDVAGNESAVDSYDVKIDQTAPVFGTPAINIAEASPYTYVSGSQLFYNAPGHTGSFTVNANVGDADSGIEHINFPTLTGTASGGGDVTSGTSTSYNWTGALSGSGSQTVTAYNNAALFQTASFTMTPDTTAPTVATPDVTDGYYTSTSVHVGLGTGAADNVGGSGVDSSSVAVQRQSVSLSNGACGTWGTTWSNVTLTAGGDDTGVTNGNCYRYRSQASDNVANVGTSDVSNVAKVDTSAPSFGGTPLSITPSGPSTSATGSTVYYNPQGTNSGGFTITPSVTDAQSGIQKVSYPALGGMTGGGDSGTSPFSSSYTWDTSAGTLATGSQSITAYNNAGASASTNLTLTQDTTGPTGGALTVNGTAASGAGSTSTSSNGNIAINTRTDYATDAGAGVQSSVLTMRSGTLSNSTCSGYGSPVTVTGTTGQSGAATGCYEYTLTGTDKVGNTSSLVTTVKVDRSAPTFGSPALSITAGNASFVNGSTVYYKGTPASQGSFTVAANPVDADSGIQKVNFAGPAGFTGGGDDTSSPYSTTYTWTSSTATGTQNVTPTNGVGTAGTAATFTLTPDNLGPTGGALTVNGVAATGSTTTTSYSKTGSFTIGTRTDFNADAGSGFASSVLTSRTGDYSPTTGLCSNYGSSSTITGNPDQTGSDGHCYEYTLTGTDNVGNTSTLVTTVIVDTTTPTITGLSLTNKSGGTAGTIEQGDKIVITYSEQMSTQSLCSSTWNGTALSNGVATINDGGAGNDTITVTSGTTCTLRLGTLTLGSTAYVTSGVSFGATGTGTSIAWDSANRQITVTLGKQASSTTVNPVTGSTTATLTPTASPNQATDLAGNPLTAAFTNASATQF